MNHNISHPPGRLRQRSATGESQAKIRSLYIRNKVVVTIKTIFKAMSPAFWRGVKLYHVRVPHLCHFSALCSHLSRIVLGRDSPVLEERERRCHLGSEEWRGRVGPSSEEEPSMGRERERAAEVESGPAIAQAGASERGGLMRW